MSPVPPRTVFPRMPPDQHFWGGRNLRVPLLLAAYSNHMVDMNRSCGGRNHNRLCTNRQVEAMTGSRGAILLHDNHTKER